MKSNRLFDRVLAASVQGIRANPKMRSVTPETLARYANEDARAVLDYAREPELSPLITANLDHKRRIAELDAELVEARRNVEAARSQTSNIASRLATVLWALPEGSIVLKASHTAKLEGRSWEIKEEPFGEGATTLTLIIRGDEKPMPAADAPMSRPRRVTDEELRARARGMIDATEEARRTETADDDARDGSGLDPLCPPLRKADA